MATGSAEQGSKSGQGQITPDLVRQVAEKVYEMWREELRIDRERARSRARGRYTGWRDPVRRAGVGR
jgi:hypothetical protein